MFTKNRILYVIFLVVGLFAIYFFHTKIVDNDKAVRDQQLQDTHKRIIERFDASIEKFAALMSGIHSKFSEDDIPTQIELQTFLQNQLKDINFSDSIVVSYLDVNHKFIYNFDRFSIDKYGLVGKKVIDFRDSLEIRRLDNVLNSDEMRLFPPINLIEGWIGIPLNFRVKNNNKPIGYIASIINFKNLIEPIYQVESSSKFAFMFSVKDGATFDREMVYDKFKVYHNRTDKEYYKNFDIPENDFTYSNISKYGLTFKLGTAYKEKYVINNSLSYMFACWSILVIFFWGLSLRSNLNVSKLNEKLLAKTSYIEVQTKELAQRNISLNDYAHIVTHDLKAPLRNLNTLFYWLKEDVEIKPGSKDLLDKMGSNIDKMDKLIEGIFEYSQLDYLEKKEEKVDFKKVIDELSGYFTSNHKVEINSNLTNLDFIGDETKIKQLFQNLIHNSIRYNDKEKCMIDIQFKKENNEFLFEFKDNGVGIEEKYFDQIFKVFQKLSDRPDSTGIGLAIVKKIVKNYNGKIWVESEVGKSTTFLFTLVSR
ncbi:MAG: HAMP domain-containing histidine kinase [Flavobacteriaceae bacterium]